MRAPLNRHGPLLKEKVPLLKSPCLSWYFFCFPLCIFVLAEVHLLAYERGGGAIIGVVVTHCAAKLPIFSEQWLEDHLIVMNKDPIRALLLATIALMMDNLFGGSHLVFFVEANKGSFSSFEFILPPGTELKTYTWKGSILFRVGASQPGDFIFLFTDKQSGSPPLTSNWET